METSTCNILAKQLPILKIKASNSYDVGNKIGNYFKQFNETNDNSGGKQLLDKFYQSTYGKNVFEEYLAKTTECYPNIVEEIRGMADGSGQPFDRLFLNCMLSEILFSTDWLKHAADEDKNEVAGCTDVLVNTDQCRLLGHNEDWTTDMSASAILVDVEIDRTTDNYGSDKSEPFIDRNERFVSLVLPGILPGMTFSMNKHLVFTINTLVPTSFNKGSVLMSILVRALLRCETIEECVSVLKCEHHGCSYGININVASITTPDMWTIEVYPDTGKTSVDVLHLPQQTSDSERKQYVHTNHYKHIESVNERPIIEGSKDREHTASGFPVPTCVEDVCNILGSRTGEVQPIFRLPTESRQVVTAASVVFDMKAKQLQVYVGNPSVEGTLDKIIPFIW